MNQNKKEETIRSFLKVFNSMSKFNIKENMRKLGISRLSFQNRFNDLIRKKIIKNFTINIHPNITPKNLKYVILEIKTNPAEPYIVEQLLKIEQLKILDGILGEFSLFALFVFESSESYYKILNEIDKIMAKSYFRKYHIIEIIKVFKTNGLNIDALHLDFDLDNVDYLILKILQNQQELRPISTYEIKNTLNENYNQIIKDYYNEGISQPTIHNRVKRLENNGCILNYTINFHPKMVGYKGKYLIRIKPRDPSKYNTLALSLEEKPFITDLFRIGEQFGLFAIVRVNEIEDYATFIKDLYTSEEIEDTFTSFVLDELLTYNNFVLY